MSPDHEELMHLRALTTQIVNTAIAAHANITDNGQPASIPQMIANVFKALQRCGQPEVLGAPVNVEVDLPLPGYTPSEVKKSIGKDSITCLLCGAKMRVLTKHLREAHNLTPADYRSQFGISKTQALAARSLSEAKRAQALTLNLAGNLRKPLGTAVDYIPATATKKSQSKPKKTKKVVPQPRPDHDLLGLD